jgi:DUF4097 and DUF4098 domain-containing protein YvlB
MGSTPPNWNPNDPGAGQPYDPTNVNDPRYDVSRDPRYDPRWQKAQQRFYRDQQRAQQNQQRAAQRAQAAAWKAQTRAQRDQWKMYWNGQRRTSIVGPLLLIAVGLVFFLIHVGRISSVGFFTWYGHWWPMLLILIGVLRLGEWAIDRARAPQDAPPMRYSVGGGVVLLVILLAGVGLATHSMQWHADRNGLEFLGFHDGGNFEHLFTGQRHEEEVPATEHAIADGARLTIESPHGDVTVSGTSDDGKLHLTVHKEVFTNSDDTANDRLRQLNPSIDGSNENLTLRVPDIRGGGADVTLLVPASVHVLVNSNRGDVHVTNLKSPLVVTANNGDTEIAAITGDVQVRFNNRHHDLDVRNITGGVVIDGDGSEVKVSDVAGSVKISGDFIGGGHVQRVGGRVDYHSSRTDLSFARLNGELEIDGHDLSATEVTGPMLVNTRSRNITLDKVSGEVKVVNSHGDVDLHMLPPAGAVTVDNQNGNVNVTIPERTRFDLHAETSDGDTHSDFSGVNSDGRGTLRGNVNGGGPQVRLTTSHGDISVTRNQMAPLPPLPPNPRVTGFGSVPHAPLPPDAAIAIESAREAVQDAKQQAAETQRETMQAAREAQREAAQATREAQRDASQATKEAQRNASQAAREAMERARDAMKQAQEKEREAERMARDATRQHD